MTAITSAGSTPLPPHRDGMASDLEWIVVHQGNVDEQTHRIEEFHALCSEEFISSELEELSVWMDNVRDGGDTKCPYIQTFMFVVRKSDSLLLGGAAQELYLESACGLVTYIVVHKEARGRGLAQQLMARTYSDLNALQQQFGREWLLHISQLTSSADAGGGAGIPPDCPVMLPHHHQHALGLMTAAPRSHIATAESLADESRPRTPTSPKTKGTFAKGLERVPIPMELNGLFVEVLQARDGIAGKFDPKERQNVWNRLGFIPLAFDFVHPGRLRGGRYQLAVMSTKYTATSDFFPRDVLAMFVRRNFEGILLVEEHDDDDTSGVADDTEIQEQLVRIGPDPQIRMGRDQWR